MNLFKSADDVRECWLRKSNDGFRECCVRWVDTLKSHDEFLECVCLDVDGTSLCWRDESDRTSPRDCDESDSTDVEFRAAWAYSCKGMSGKLYVISIIHILNII